MSLSSIKAKEAKGKRKTLPKLKTILANPYKSKCASLDETEIENILKVLDLALSKSGLAPNCFAKAKGICIGLESVLRSINNGRVSCVFLSLSIKPHHVVELVAQNVEVKCATAPVYATSQLEKLTHRVFGIHALALSLPRLSEDLCTELKDWIFFHQKPVKERLAKLDAKPRSEKKPKIVMEEDTYDEFEALNNTSTETKPDWSGDFISFSSSSKSKRKVDLNLEQDKTKLLGVLNQMTKNVQISPLEGNAVLDVVGVSIKDEKFVSSIDNYDSDEFLQSYKPLEVHTILPNAEKKPKKKRKNKK